MLCTICDHAITNPLCPGCLGKSIGVWAGEKNIQFVETPTPDDNGVACIKCGSLLSICPHCICRDVYDELEENDVESAREFAAHFDFELRRELSE